MLGTISHSFSAFDSNLVGNPEDRFSSDAAHYQTYYSSWSVNDKWAYAHDFWTDLSALACIKQDFFKMCFFKFFP